MRKPSTSWIILDTVHAGNEMADPVGTVETKPVGQQNAVSAAQAIARWKYKTGFREGDHMAGGAFWEVHTLTAVRESEYRKAGQE